MKRTLSSLFFSAFVLAVLLTARIAAADQEDYEEASTGHWGFSGAASLGSNYLGLRVSVQYFFNSFIGIDTSANYNKVTAKDASAVHYGPESTLILRLANPTMITPYVGAGLGYELWEREEERAIFDDSSSPLGIYFAGIGLGLSQNVSLNAQNTWRTYLDDAPRQFGNHSQRENETQSSLGFGIVFSF